MIYGIGVDVVDIARFATKINANQKLKERIFTAAERQLNPKSLAARFAAKEALVKAFGGSAIKNSSADIVCELSYQDIEVKATDGEKPKFTATGQLTQAMNIAGVHRAHLSLSHDGPVAIAYVILENALAPVQPVSATAITAQASNNLQERD